ncbi:MAG: TrmH family RNA methyltransferase [Christensenellaceae bacterium]
MLINSRQNSKVRLAISLKQKKYRKEHKKYLVEGEKMVKEAFLYGEKVDFVLVCDKYYDTFKDCDTEVYLTTDEIIKAVSDEVTPQGVVAVVSQRECETGDILSTSVVLDGVSDAGNLGTILRVMTATGVRDVYLIDCVDSYSPKVVRSSMSGIFNVRCHDITFDEFVAKVKVPLYFADMSGENLFRASTCGAFCLVLGSEAHGISQRFYELPHETVSVPMKNGLESLNVGVCSGIILYQLLKDTF